MDLDEELLGEKVEDASMEDKMIEDDLLLNQKTYKGPALPFEGFSAN